MPALLTLPGGHSEWEPPDPIPNSVVKTLSADDSMGGSPCESRSLPGNKVQMVGGRHWSNSTSVVENGLASEGPHIRLLNDLSMRFVPVAKPGDYKMIVI